jgi:Pyruvate/2-oxoacid:ferredoxin oxidoreductase delta subunit
MRTDGKYFNQKLLAELYYQYVNVEGPFMQRIFGMKTPIDRIFVQEEEIDPRYETIVLDYERASHIINTASCITVGRCYCRHKMEHIGKSCDKPQHVCLSLNKVAESLHCHHISKKISREKAHEILKECVSLGLVQLGDNVQERVNWICNCCPCCCEGLLSYKKLGYNLGSSFFSTVDIKTCSGCGICARRCPVDAVTMRAFSNGKIFPEININQCIGCGVCSRFCPSKSIELKRRYEAKFIPKDSFERYIINAIETGRLQNYIFDNYTLWTHALLRRFLGIILSLKPAKRLLAQKQVQSRFINALIKTDKYTIFNKLYNVTEKPDYTHPELKK